MDKITGLMELLGEENNTYNVDQKSNYIFMRDSLQRMAVAQIEPTFHK